jgi:hypothetical protein
MGGNVLENLLGFIWCGIVTKNLWYSNQVKLKSLSGLGVRLVSEFSA